MTDNRYEFLEINGWATTPTDEAPRGPVGGGTPVSASAHLRASGARSEFRAAEIIGEYGYNAGQFNRPGGVSVDREGTLFVADAFNHRLQRITLAGDVDVIGGAQSPASGRLNLPAGVASDRAGCIFVIEQGGHRLRKYGPTGILIYALGTLGAGMMQFSAPRALVLDDAHNIYIADTSNNRVVSISPRGQYRGQLLQGQPNEPLNRPAAVAVGPGGVLAVADSWNHRVVLFDTKGKPGMVFGGRGVERGQLNQPCGVVFDLDGGLIVSDTGNNRLQKFSPSGIPVAVWYGDGAVGNLNNPGCVALTRDGDIYLADTGNHRVLRFEMW